MQPSFAGLFAELTKIRRECFYGKCMGFYYPPGVRDLLKVIGIAMASYSIRFGGTKQSPKPAGILKTAYKSGLFFFR